MTFTVSRHLSFCFALFVILTSCSKDSAPPTNSTVTTKIFLIGVEQQLYIAEKGFVEITGGIEGRRENYSSTTVYAVSSNQDTLGSALVNGDRFSIRLDSTTAPGEYNVHITTKDPDADRTLVTDVVKVFSCIPPTVDISEAEVTGKSVLLKWFARKVYNFKAYEIYAKREGSDTARLVKTITNQDVSNYLDSSIFLHHRYFYYVQIVTENDCSSGVAYRSVQVGAPDHLFEGCDLITSVQDPLSAVVYMAMPDYYQREQSHTRQLDMDNWDEWPVAKSFEYGSYLAGVSESNEIQIIARESVNTSRLHWYNHATHTTGQGNQVVILAARNETVKAVWDRNLVLYAGDDGSQGYIKTHNLSSQTTTEVWRGAYLNVLPIDKGKRFVLTTKTDSFYIYSMVTRIPVLEKKGYCPQLSTMAKRNVCYGTGIYTIGNIIFDSDNNVRHSLPPDQYVIGVSGDGQYLISSRNDIYETNTFSVVHKYGEGIPGIAYFSGDNNTIMHITDDQADIYNDRGLVYKYTWR